MAVETEVPEILLVIDELPEPVFISIFGERYRMRTPAERSLAETVDLGRTHREFQEAMAGELNEERVRILANRLREMASTILPDAPDDVLARLTDGQRLQIVETFNSYIGASS